MRPVMFRGMRLTDCSPAELTAAVVDATRARCGLAVTFVNPHSFNLLEGDASRSFASDLRVMDLVCADGIGVCLAARVLTGEALNRVSFDLWAPELFAALAEHDVAVYLVGGKGGVAEAAARAIEAEHEGLRIVGTNHGYLNDTDLATVADAIACSGAQVLVVGAGAPVQEHLTHAFHRLIPDLVVLTCGGYFDQVILPSPYYPSWAYPLRLNWVVRLAREPRRLWRRYLLGNPTFLWQSAVWSIRRWLCTLCATRE